MFEYLRKTPKVYDAVFSLLTAIQSGEYDTKKSLPSIRKLSEKLNVSNFTVYRALEELKNAGIIQANGKKANYLSGKPIPDLMDNDSNATQGEKAVSLLVRSYSDINKLHSMLIRDKFHQHLADMNEDISVKEIQSPLEGYNHIIDLTERLLSGEEPCTGIITQSFLEFLHEFKMIAPIDGYPFIDDYLANIDPNLQNICALNNRMYLLPNSITMSYLVCNKACLSDSKTSAEEISGDWKSFENALTKLKKWSNQVPMQLHNCQDLVFWLFHLIHQSIKLDNGQKLLPIDWNSSEIDPALKFFHRLIFKLKLIDTTTNNVNDKSFSIIPRMINGEIPLTLDSGQVAGAILRSGYADRFTILPLPSGPNNRQLSLGNVSGWFINSRANDEIRETAARYIFRHETWIHSKQGSETVRTFKNSGNPYSIYKDKNRDHLNPTDLPGDWHNAFYKLRKIMMFEPQGSDWEKPVMAEAMESIWNDKSSVDIDKIKIYFSTHLSNLSLPGKNNC